MDDYKVQIKTVFTDAVQRLNQAGIPEPELEASLLLASVVKMDRTTLLLAGRQIIDADQLENFKRYIARRMAREPLAYIIGEKEFWSLPFNVTKDVLIPRPETELLLEKAIAILKSPKSNPVQTGRFLDLGTGSGVIAIILALEFPGAEITAIDYSFQALQVASHNAKKHGVGGRINFINSDWFGGIGAEPAFEAVIANPPYIAGDILAKPFGAVPGSLEPEVGCFEPSLALDGGVRGMEEISRIAADLGQVLKPGGWFFMEIGADQEKEVVGIFTRTDAYDNIAVAHDFAGLPRIFQARKYKGPECWSTGVLG